MEDYKKWIHRELYVAIQYSEKTNKYFFNKTRINVPKATGWLDLGSPHFSPSGFVQSEQTWWKEGKKGKKIHVLKGWSQRSCFFFSSSLNRSFCLLLYSWNFCVFTWILLEYLNVGSLLQLLWLTNLPVLLLTAVLSLNSGLFFSPQDEFFSWIVIWAVLDVSKVWVLLYV